MNKEEPIRDQAEKLRRKIEKVEREKDPLHLPPRSEVHNDKKKTTWRIKYPILRILFIIFILLPLISISIYLSKNFEEDKMIEQKKHFETVEIKE